MGDTAATVSAPCLYQLAPKNLARSYPREALAFARRSAAAAFCSSLISRTARKGFRPMRNGYRAHVLTVHRSISLRLQPEQSRHFSRIALTGFVLLVSGHCISLPPVSFRLIHGIFHPTRRAVGPPRHCIPPMTADAHTSGLAGKIERPVVLALFLAGHAAPAFAASA